MANTTNKMQQIIRFNSLGCSRLLIRAGIDKNSVLSNHSAQKYSTVQTSSNENSQGLKVEQITIPVPWGSVRGQIFGNPKAANAKPLLCLHGYLDNSNSFRPIAPYMTKSDEYYMIALDLPGHGHSSKLPNGIPYSNKMLINTLRRCVRHLDLTKFFFFCHSYGVYMSLFYQTIFRNEVIASVSFDWVAPERRKLNNIAELISKSIDKFINDEYFDMAYQSKQQHHQQQQQQQQQPQQHRHHHPKPHKRELTREIALELLLNANKNLDADAAKTLLDRGLIVGEDGKLNFSRDRKAKISLASADSFSEFVSMTPFITRNQPSPHLMIHSVPFAYGERKGEDTIIFLDRIRAESKVPVESVFFRGTHHLHMMQPKEVGQICLDYLKQFKKQ